MGQLPANQGPGADGHDTDTVLDLEGGGQSASVEVTDSLGLQELITAVRQLEDLFSG